MSNNDHQFSVYDGGKHVGYIDVVRGGQFRAYDAAGKLVGTFKTQRDAMRSIPEVDHGQA